MISKKIQTKIGIFVIAICGFELTAWGLLFHVVPYQVVGSATIIGAVIYSAIHASQK